eukprot:6059317-Heterocapsa_arctica.AAC.1
MQILERSHVSLSILRAVLGSWSAAMMHRRPCMALFSAVYALIQSLPDDDTPMPWPVRVRDELFATVIFAPL